MGNHNNNNNNNIGCMEPLINAVIAGDIDFIKHVHKKCGYCTRERLCVHVYDWARVGCLAILHGHINILGWMHEAGLLTLEPCVFDEESHIDPFGEDVHHEHRWCDAAAECEEVEMLAWLHDKGYTWGTSTCAAAARQGHLEVLKYLRDQGCEWDDDTTTCAARDGHIGVFEWSIDHGCSYNKTRLHTNYPEINARVSKLL